MSDEGSKPDSGTGDEPIFPKVQELSTADDALRLIDACLSVEDGNWEVSVKTRASFRVPRIEARFLALETAAKAADPTVDFRYEFRRQCETTAKSLADKKFVWAKPEFASSQIVKALKGEAVRFDKAVVLSVTANHFADELSFPWELALDDARGKSVRVAWHGVAAQMFFFKDLALRLQEAEADLRTKTGDYLFSIMKEIPEIIGQPLSFVEDAAVVAPDPRVKNVTPSGEPTLASYRPLRKLYKFLQRVPMTRVRFQETHLARKENILQQKTAMTRRKSTNLELIDATQKITTGPYGWPSADGERSFPPADDLNIPDAIERVLEPPL